MLYTNFFIIPLADEGEESYIKLDPPLHELAIFLWERKQIKQNLNQVFKRKINLKTLPLLKIKWQPFQDGSSIY